VAKKPITISTITAGEGAKVFGSLRVGELSDGSSVDIPVIVVNGVKPGPTLYLGAAIHANELTGVEIIRRIISEIDPKKLAGAVIAVPIQNPLAFRAKHPVTPYYYQKEVTDMWAALPGDPNLGLTEIIAHVLVKEVISKADYVIDFHTGFPAEEFAILVPPSEQVHTQSKALELAKAFGIEAIEMFPSKLSDLAKATHSVAIDVELGENSRLDEKYIAMGVKGVGNVMKYLRMIKGNPELPEKQKFFKGRVQVRAGRGGLIITKVKCLQEIKKGQLIASIYNLFTMEEVEQVRAPREGTILRILTYPTVNMGDRIAAIGY
jgi:predicted deacylase